MYKNMLIVLIAYMVLGMPSHARTLKEELQSAKHYFDQKAYIEAYEAFYTLFTRYTNHIRINYFLGLSALALQKYEEAIAAFERVLIQKPLNVQEELLHTQARLQLGQLYFLTGAYTQAKQELQKVLNAPQIDHITHDKIVLLLGQIDQKERRHFFNATVSLGMLYDSNVYNDVGTEVYLILPHVLAGGIRGNTPKADGIDQEMVSIAHRYIFSRNFAWQTAFMGFSQSFWDTPQRNILYGMGSTGISWHEGIYDSALLLAYDRVGMGADALLNAWGAKGNLGMRVGENIRTSAYLNYQQKHYVEGFEHMNGSVWDAGGRLDVVWGGGVWHWNVAGSVAREDAPHSAIMDRSWRMIQSTLEWQLLPKLRLAPMVSYRTMNFAQSMLDAMFTLSSRTDTQLQAQAVLAWSFSKTWALSATWGYLQNDSTHSAFEYIKYSGGVNVRKDFGW